MTVDQHRDAVALERAIVAMGGVVDQPADGSGMVSATLTAAQLMQVIHDNTVMWADRWGPPGYDNGQFLRKLYEQALTIEG